MQEYYC